MKGMEVPLIGYCAWWNVRNLDLTRDQFETMLKECDLPIKYAREHNYRSAFIRALRNLEEQRIIRKVSEDDDFLVFQFTAESLIGGKNGRLDYVFETKVIVNKNTYYETRDFAQALVQSMPGYEANPEVTKEVIKQYNLEKVRYRSGDVTRCLQRILTEEADIIPLRDQGNVYFIPAKFTGVVEKISRLVSKLSPTTSDVRFDCLEIPDAEKAKTTVGRSAIQELESIIETLSADVANPDHPATEQARMSWAEARLRKVKKIKDRLELYGDIIEDVKVKELETGIEDLAKQIYGSRQIED
jgi:hypothetical protein